MREQLTGIAVLLTVAALVLSSTGCGTTSNANVDVSRNQNQAISTESERFALLASSACSEDFDDRKDAIIEKVRDRINDNAKLKKQHDGNPGNHVPPKFEFHIDKAPDGQYFFATIEGEVAGDDGLKDLAGILNDFNKKGCLLKVYFVPMGKYEPSIDRYPPIGFGWTACEDPMVACPNGECKNPPCVDLDGNSNKNTNMNTNSRTNSNTNH
jgi:hypothetical protein